MDIRSTLAVVDDHFFYYRIGGCIQHFGFQGGLHELLEEVERTIFTHVWVVPGTSISTLLSRDMNPLQTWILSPIYQNSREQRYSFLSARRPGARHEESIYIGFPEFSSWLWEGDSDPLILLKTVTWLEDALGLPLEWTAPHMSMQYVRKLNESRWSWLAPLTLDLEKETPGFSYDACAIDLHWPPPGHQVAIPEGATHEIIIDGNSAFAAGMTSLNIGEGNPEWVDGPWAYDGKRPGFWTVACWRGESIFDGERLPDMKRQWMTTDLIEQLRAVDYQIEIIKGWTWLDSRDGKKRYHQTLRSTAEGLWALRSKWRTIKEKSAAHANVYETLRIVLKAIQGKFGDMDNSNARFRRRDIWSAVGAKNVARMIYWIEKIYREFGLLPDGIKVDELRYYVSDPHIFDSMLGTEKLGGFKLVEVREL